jgi:hypothetical protein
MEGFQLFKIAPCRKNRKQQMSEMSPLAKALMSILRSGSWAAMVLLLLFMGIFLWQQIKPDGTIALTRQDYGFLGVVGFLVLLSIYLVRAIGKEIGRGDE